MSMLPMIGDWRNHLRTVQCGTSVSRIAVLCVAASLMVSPGCQESTTPAVDDTSRAGAATDVPGDRELPPTIELANIADIRDADGHPPQRPDIDPTQIIQQNDLDQLLGFLYWEREPNWRDETDVTLLARAATIGRQEMVETLIRYGADVNAIVRINNTAIHWAVRRDQVEIVKILLANGADPNVKGGPDRSMTPLQLAISRGNQDMIELLRRHGAEE